MLAMPTAPIDPVWLRRAADYQATLTMPPGALGRLLDLASQLCAIQETLKPCSEPAAVVIMAADHGIAAEGVSAYPQDVTGQMVRNFLSGGAAINVLARRSGARLLVVDLGVKNRAAFADALPHADFIEDLSVAAGTANFLHGPAMSEEQLQRALTAGRQVGAQVAAQGVRVVVLGEMGIGNTTSASALTAAVLALPAARVTGHGTGVSAEGLSHKIAVIDSALGRHFGMKREQVAPLAALAAVGGFEIAGLVGLALEAAMRRLVIVLDGFISSTAGLLAARLEPATRDYLVASHGGVEVGHRIVLDTLGLTPLFQLGFRLGEGSGGAMALTMLHSAADLMRDMATFRSAGVSEQ
jgi:nicotinate-nucleotide--dimethylbenzimidazole phosphoribosyltransferase